MNGIQIDSNLIPSTKNMDDLKDFDSIEKMSEDSGFFNPEKNKRNPNGTLGFN